MLNKYYINVYELDRKYGGPEEGGWWFTTGTPAGTEVAFTMEDAVEIRAKIMSELVMPRHRLGSVRYAGGEFTVLIEEHSAKKFPEQWPHYE